MKKDLTLHSRWNKCCQQLGIIPETSLYFNIIRRYCEPQRHYHTLQHLEECFLQLDSCDESELDIKTAALIEMTLWFHDVIYEVKGVDNEKKSADFAEQVLQEAGLDPSLIEQIYDLILITRHDKPPSNEKEKWLVDIDLSILGAHPMRFKEYEEQILAEYSWIDEALFWQNRKRLLRTFLARPRIYQTEHFYTRLEETARINLAYVL